MFDRVWINCPKCGEAVEFQSKVHNCTLTDYSLETAPDIILYDIEGDQEKCPQCGHLVTIKSKTKPSFIVE